MYWGSQILDKVPPFKDTKLVLFEKSISDSGPDICQDVLSEAKSRGFSDEIIAIIKSKRDEIIFKMKITSKEETEVQNRRIENLESWIKEVMIEYPPIST